VLPVTPSDILNPLDLGVQK